MKVTRQISVLIDTTRKVVVRGHDRDAQIWCERCCEQMVTVQMSPVVHGISTRDVYRLVEEGEIHFVETESKVIFVCPNFIQLTGK